MPPFTWSDTWLLLSIGTGGETGATLKDIIAAGDFLNHAIFTGAELRRGFAKLLAAGYVVKVADRFQVAGQALTLLREFSGSPTRSVWNECDRLLGLKPGSYASDANVEDPNWCYAPATDKAVQAAYREFVGDGAAQTAMAYATQKRP